MFETTNQSLFISAKNWQHIFELPAKVPTVPAFLGQEACVQYGWIFLGIQSVLPSLINPTVHGNPIAGGKKNVLSRGIVMIQNEP
jgi:hypothetical protein